MGALKPTGLYVHGHGEPRTLVVPNPAAGAGVTFTVPGAEVWRPVSLVFTYTASAGAANRFVSVQYRDQTGTPYCVNAAGLVLVANDALRFDFAAHRGVAEWAANTDVLAPLEPAILMFGETILVTALNIQAGDQLSTVRLRVEQWPVASGG